MLRSLYCACKLVSSKKAFKADSLTGFPFECLFKAMPFMKDCCPQSKELLLECPWLHCRHPYRRFSKSVLTVQRNHRHISVCGENTGEDPLLEFRGFPGTLCEAEQISNWNLHLGRCLPSFCSLSRRERGAVSFCFREQKDCCLADTSKQGCF